MMPTSLQRFHRQSTEDQIRYALGKNVPYNSSSGDDGEVLDAAHKAAFSKRKRVARDIAAHETLERG